MKDYKVSFRAGDWLMNVNTECFNYAVANS